MSRLCRLRNASHGNDGQWAYSEIVGLREQVEKLTKFAQNAEQLYYKDMAERTTQIEALTKERDELVNAIDNEMVVTHMGVFNAGDDPKVALNKICCYAQDLGKFFAEDACKEQLAALAEQNEKMRVALQAMVDEAFARNCGLKIADDALALPDLASPVLNRIRAEGMEMAADICSEKHSLSGAEGAIRARAAELEASSHD